MVDSPLLAACAGGHPDCVHLLIDSRADVNHAGPRGETALHLASARAELPTMGKRPFVDEDAENEHNSRGSEGEIMSQ